MKLLLLIEIIASEYQRALKEANFDIKNFRTEDRKVVTKCIHSQISEKCEPEEGNGVTKSLDHLLKYSETNELCGKEHGLFKYEFVLLVLERDAAYAENSPTDFEDSSNELSLDD